MLQPAANGLTNGERSYVLYCSDTCVACSDGLLALNKLSVADERCAIFLRATASSGPGFHFLAKIWMSVDLELCCGTCKLCMEFIDFYGLWFYVTA